MTLILFHQMQKVLKSLDIFLEKILVNLTHIEYVHRCYNRYLH